MSLPDTARWATAHRPPRTSRGLTIVAAEPARLRRVVALQVLRPPIGDGLVTQLDLHRERPGRPARADLVADAIAAADEVGIVRSRAVDADLRVGGGLVEAARQQPVVLEVLRGRQEPVVGTPRRSPRIGS